MQVCKFGQQGFRALLQHLVDFAGAQGAAHDAEAQAFRGSRSPGSPPDAPPKPVDLVRSRLNPVPVLRKYALANRVPSHHHVRAPPKVLPRLRKPEEHPRGASECVDQKPCRQSWKSVGLVQEDGNPQQPRRKARRHGDVPASPHNCGGPPSRQEPQRLEQPQDLDQNCPDVPKRGYGPVDGRARDRADRVPGLWHDVPLQSVSTPNEPHLKVRTNTFDAVRNRDSWIDVSPRPSASEEDRGRSVVPLDDMAAYRSDGGSGSDAPPPAHCLRPLVRYPPSRRRAAAAHGRRLMAGG
mmetsp:Transcript_826/g.2426  ORF Transcript_826/g.2426 Transcript_826/m.2426 type:complete len:296 (-) Transcript_826:961-1848(-)